MQTMLQNLEKHLQGLMDELKNFQEMAKYLKPSPGEIPTLNGVDIYGRSIPLNGIIGGDHIIYVDFSRRYDLDVRIARARATGRRDVEANLLLNRTRGGILIADASGHRVTDALLTAMLHQAFLIGASYELDLYGHITTTLFEAINTRFFKSSAIDKYLTMVYGEISENGVFKFISAGHPTPVVFSREWNRLVDLREAHLVAFPPIGFMPSQEDVDIRRSGSAVGYKEEYEVNKIDLMGHGDILLLYTDGLSDHRKERVRYFPKRLEEKLRQVKDLPAERIFHEILTDMLSFAEPADDVTYVVIKRL